MTRLIDKDICNIPAGLARYDAELKKATGKSMLGIAAHAWGGDEADVSSRLKALKIHVIPVTAGQGIITNFSRTVAAILNFLGCDGRVAQECDASGLAEAYEQGADAVMLADDLRFVGIDLKTRKVADNSLATGRVFAAALDLMAGGIDDHPVLVMGCGPVGGAGAKALAVAGARVFLYDINKAMAVDLKDRLVKADDRLKISILDSLAPVFSDYSYVLEATPVPESIPDEWVTNHLRVAAPGVPLGVSKTGAEMLSDGLVHDKLELGVAAMAVNLVIDDMSAINK